MIAFKGFRPGLVCLGYQFQMGLNVTEKANCHANGFHCAENPLDCLSYYPDMEHSVYCVVNAGGDMDEDGSDTKIACTELTILKKLTREEFFLHALAFMMDHPQREWSDRVQKDRAEARDGYAVVRGKNPMARGCLNDILAFAREGAGGRVVQASLARVDGNKMIPGVWYDADLTEREVLFA